MHRFDVGDETLIQKVDVLDRGIWGVLKKEQQVKSLQLACDLLVVSAVRGDDPLYLAYRPQLQDSVRQVSALMYVIASAFLGDPNLIRVTKDASGQAQQANVSLVSLVAPICDAISKVKGFEEVKPPKIQGAPEPQGTAASNDDASKSAGK